MDRTLLLDRMNWGMNIAARAMGVASDLYRPRGPINPLAPAHRIMPCMLRSRRAVAAF